MHLTYFLKTYERHPAVRVMKWHLVITTSTDTDEIAAHGLLCLQTLRAGMRLAERQGLAFPEPGDTSN